jgi:O-antigen/teichoic acid export membrane protein
VIAIGSLIRKMLPDKAVGYSMANTMASALAMPVTVIMVGHYLTPNQQGLFYTFGSVLALQVLFEMGFSQCLLQFFSHEYASLTLVERRFREGVDGLLDLRRMAAIYSIARRWYTVIAILVPSVLGPAGHIFFLKNASIGDNWIWGWWGLCISTGLYIYIQPKTLVLDGCQQVAVVAKLRLWGNIARLLCLSGSLALGAGLASPAWATLLSTGVLAFGLNRDWKQLFKQLSNVSYSGLSRFFIWRKEIWPFQWKISLSWAAGYFIFNAFNPIILHYEGAIEAGKFGMTWVVMQGVSNIAATFGSARVTRYGSLVAQKKWDDLYRLWRSSAIQSFFISCIGVLFVFCLFVLMHELEFSIVSRLSSAWVLVLLGIGTITNQIVFAQAFYLRAHKDDPFLSLSLLSALGVFLLTITLVPSFGGLGAAFAYAIVTLGFTLPIATWVFIKKRKSCLF